MHMSQVDFKDFLFEHVLFGLDEHVCHVNFVR